MSNPQVPFPESKALDRQRLLIDRTDAIQSVDAINHIPGDPTINLSRDVVTTYVKAQMSTPLLDEMHHRLWLVAKRQSRNIDPIDNHRVKGRTIIATDAIRLHLVWYKDRIYVKPVPEWLLNFDFWSQFLQDSDSGDKVQSFHPTDDPTTPSNRSMALGFMRSYAMLVPSRIAFQLAQDCYLIPAHINWLEWAQFIACFSQIEDHQVAKRYQYGQIRLSRLNWAVRIFRFSLSKKLWFYEFPRWSITETLSQATIPLFFVFASATLVLSSMQVILSVPDEDLWLGPDSSTYLKRSFWILSIVILSFSFLVWIVLFEGLWNLDHSEGQTDTETKSQK
ncbi:unnamed protein product [Clonostachys rosea]|uniref:Uncharacterized protein n=1 Tax=Bionectria ochroleuca TaxID=29856 RepID=A0ABY6UEF3_BIOOC|nr:unnamed protein product [Clonostachys rosea]